MGRWRGGAGRSAVTAVATSRGRRLTQLAVSTIGLICSGADSLVQTRRALGQKRQCMKKRSKEPSVALGRRDAESVLKKEGLWQKTNLR